MGMFDLIVPVGSRSVAPPERWPVPGRAVSPRGRARPPEHGSKASLRARSTARRSGRGETKRRGRRTPAPAQSRRAAFSFMSPTCGHATTAQPHASARASVPWPAWQMTSVARGHRARVGDPLDDPCVRRARAADARAAAGSRSRAPGPARRPGRAARLAAAGGRGPGRSMARSGRADASPGGSSTSRAGGSHISGPTTCAHGRPDARVLELRERGRRAPVRG